MTTAIAEDWGSLSNGPAPARLKWTTIKKANLSGKWIEFWVDGDTRCDFDGTWSECSKRGYFWEAIEAAGLDDYCLNHGVCGLVICWEHTGFDWGIKSVARPTE